MSESEVVDSQLHANLFWHVCRRKSGLEEGVSGDDSKILRSKIATAAHTDTCTETVVRTDSRRQRAKKGADPGRVAVGGADKSKLSTNL